MAQDATQDRVTIQEAARRLGIKDDAIRKRIQRGTLKNEKDPDGRVYVYLEATQDRAQDASQDKAKDKYRDAAQDISSREELVETLKDQVGYLRQQLDTRTEELRRKDHIIAALTERIPELEAPREDARGREEPPQDASEDPDGVEVTDASPETQNGAQSTTEEASRPWWKRIFG